jgi:hypothetical protein
MMETPPTTQPDPAGVEAIPPDALSPPKWSASAIAGFVLSFLLILAPLGVLLGIVGIIRSWGGQRRGMGLAVAAVPIGVLMSCFVGWLSLAGYVYYRTLEHAQTVAGVMETSAVRVPEVAAEFYSARGKRFQQAVTKEEFEKWLRGVIEKHGSLQRLKPPQNMRLIDPGPNTDELTFNFIGEFVNGSAHIGVTTGPPSLEPELRNIAVEGVPAVTDHEHSPVKDGS